MVVFFPIHVESLMDYDDEYHDEDVGWASLLQKSHRRSQEEAFADLLLDPQQILMVYVAAALKAIGYEIEFKYPKVLASRTYQGTSFAGPRTEDGKNCLWWMVDLGVDHQVIVLLSQPKEFLSMKLATVNPEVNIDIDRLVFKDISFSTLL
ncbi:hypothetical protein L1987_40318 [Smallanthus sonchifolius]|uniref:Uncharacterized protein n=1 Tax=Smallanthus sonchifolius TaxID=185202 RepID=A0ACB9GST9_9ASTR|nr:hypothetical protein L1987_40318 [Smallanthus sonchifolius]